jgi:hypothetical protein
MRKAKSPASPSGRPASLRSALTLGQRTALERLSRPFWFMRIQDVLNARSCRRVVIVPAAQIAAVEEYVKTLNVS